MTIIHNKNANILTIKCKLEELNIIPSTPCASKKLNSEQMNLWELHEIIDEQDIDLELKYTGCLIMESK